MPELKALTCNVEWSGSNTPLAEYQTGYADGYVETYIAVPPLPTNFTVHIQSSGYIAAGLAVFVYMDGVYQCNRNRINLRMPAQTSNQKNTEIDFRLRQREYKRLDGSLEAQTWNFAKAGIGMSLATLL